MKYSTYYSGLLCITIVLCLVGLYPFAARTGLALVQETGAGDTIRQVTFLAVFLLAVMPFALARPLVGIVAIPHQLWLVYAWCLVTLTWSQVPEIGFRRLAFTILVSGTLLICVRQLSVKRAYAVISGTFIALTVLSLVAAVIYPQGAIHQPNDPEIAVVGGLRGLFYHKNMTGVVAGIGFLMAYSALLRRRSHLTALFAALCLVTLWLTDSMTSLALACFCLLPIHLAPVMQRSQSFRRNAAIVISLMLLLGLLFAVTLTLEGALGSSAFTGRGEIWHYVWELVLQRPLTGHGFGSVFQVGSATPLSSVASSSWVERVAHAHNGYLELLASTGMIGLAILLAALVSLTRRGMLSLQKNHPSMVPVIASVIIFCLAHNLLETGLLDRADPVWTTLILIFGLFLAERRPSERGARGNVMAGIAGAPN